MSLGPTMPVTRGMSLVIFAICLSCSGRALHSATAAASAVLLASVVKSVIASFRIAFARSAVIGAAMFSKTKSTRQLRWVFFRQRFLRRGFQLPFYPRPQL